MYKKSRPNEKPTLSAGVRYRKRKLAGFKKQSMQRALVTLTGRHLTEMQWGLWT